MRCVVRRAQGQLADSANPRRTRAEQQLREGGRLPGREPGGGPAENREGVDPEDIPAIDEEAEEDSPGGESEGEADLDISVVVLIEAEVGVDVLGKLVERQAVHVVEHGRQQEQAANPPAPVTPTVELEGRRRHGGSRGRRIARMEMSLPGEETRR
jgi:hypothetical protein